MTQTRSWLAVLVSLSSITACAPKEEPLPMTLVTSQANCQHIDKGAHVVTYAELAKIRGAQLIELAESPLERATALHLVAISLGPQPAPGYRVVVREVSQAAANAEITVRVELEQPPWDALRSESPANPCLVLGFESGREFGRVRVETDGELLGTVDLVSAQ